MPTCDDNFKPPLCSELYHDQDQTPRHPHGDGSCVDACDCGGVPCGEYLWDHRNASLRQYLIDNILGPTGLADSNITGFYFDDGWANTSQKVLPWEPQPEGFCDHSPIGGATEEDSHCSEDMGLTQADTTAITDGWRATMSAVYDAVVAAGGWAWQLWYTWSVPSQATCATTLRQLCTEGTSSGPYTNALFVGYTGSPNVTQFDEDFATFMLVRGPYAWIGFAWVGCITSYEYPANLTLEYGTPTGTCAETSPGSGVFTRDFTLATATMDCGAYKGSVRLK